MSPTITNTNTNTSGTAGNVFMYNQQLMAPPTIYSKDDSKSLQTNATISTRRNERGGYLQSQMPLISGRKNMNNY